MNRTSEEIGKNLHKQVDSFWWRGTWEKEGGGRTLNHAVHHLGIYKRDVSLIFSCEGSGPFDLESIELRND